MKGWIENFVRVTLGNKREEENQYSLLKREVSRQRRRVYLFSLFTVCAFVDFLQIFVSGAWFALLSAVFAAAACFIYRRYWRVELRQKSKEYDGPAYEYLQFLSDKYMKRSLNGIALLVTVLSVFVLSELSFYFLGNSKSDETMENMLSNFFYVEIFLYICIKNGLCVSMVKHRIRLPEKKLYRRHCLGIAIFSVVYWIALLAITIIFDHNFVYPTNVFLAAGIFFFGLILIYNLTLRKKITHQNIVLNKQRVSIYAVIIMMMGSAFLLRRETWYTQPYINATPVIEHNTHDISYNEETGVYTITSSTEEFKILHLTDIHLGGSLYSYWKDIKALEACYSELAYTKPDLVIVTGDLCFPLGIMSMSFNNTAPVNQFAAFMRNTSVPWAFTYGNHDTESLSSASKGDFNEILKSLSYKTSANLLYPYVQPEITGRNNQLIEIRNTDGTLNQALFLIDSNAYTGEGINVYDYIHDDQVDWYAGEVERLQAEEGHGISSLAFIHIPLQQYRTAYELYEKGSSEVTYFFGENGEKMIDKVCCSEYPSRLFEKMLDLGSTKGIFCGHDHYNNMSLEYRGIRLTYGMSIDYLAMPGIESDTKQRGAELITVHEDSSWDLEQIPLTSITK